MSATLPDVVIPKDQYVSLNNLSGVAIGTAILLQVKGSTWINLVESVTQPAPTVVDGVYLTSLTEGYATARIPQGGFRGLGYLYQ